MTNKSKVQNPLTIIAIFAGIAEIAGTGVLLGLPLDIQRIFIWFVMLFPVGLVALFFLVLLFKHKVLYAPSDFVDENNFMNLLQNKKVHNEISEVVELLEKTKEHNKANNQIVEKLDEALYKLEIAKKSNELSHESTAVGNNLVVMSRGDKHKVQHEIRQTVKGAGIEGISRKEILRKLGITSVLFAYAIAELMENNVITFRDNKYFSS
ncbi:hypothetical protein MKY48_08585 [Paenibacillus sp. FSL W8-0187]|uniref:hypothetical protein n=1 Tax=Paenibacillus sp. FSL W8-0187 TaxID=2921710 RepID=UPI0030DBE161